ncbi:hypothetical protein SDC9_205531 [bioreactor metagenome]|uniref:Mannose-6-phosphate isomerase n=1 Tax=bioreactor metagenome TaxID=1076179 RepID=A0A645J361_9ZZZZ
MNPYEEIDVFDGGWKSSATGRVTDFNLMTSKECIGGMSVISNSSVVEIKPAENFNKKNWLMFFCGYGSSSFKISTGETIMITKGDLLVFENITPETKINIQTTDSKLIKMYVRY